MKKIIGIVCIIVMIAVYTLFYVMPSSDIYLHITEIDGYQEVHYSLKSAMSIQRTINQLELIKENPESIYGEKTLVLGSGTTLIINDKQYAFYKVYEDDEVLVTVTQKDQEEIEGYTKMKQDEFNFLSQKMNYVSYDDLSVW